MKSDCCKDKTATLKAKSDLANYLGIHRNTITNKFNDDTYWNSDKGIVYQSNKHYKRDRRGNRDNMPTKQGKANGEIELKHPKKR